VDSPERFEEHLLRGIRRVCGVAQHLAEQAEKRGMEVPNQRVERRRRACLELGDDLGFIPSPSEGLCHLGHDAQFLAMNLDLRSWAFRTLFCQFGREGRFRLSHIRHR
jgi:hypothetical protein